MADFLKVEGLVAGYEERPVLRGVDFELRQGEVLSLLGHNGAGKTTLLKTIFGLVRRRGGTIALEGISIDSVWPQDMVQAGISLIPEGRGVFPNLTVSENFRLGLWAASVSEDLRAERTEWVLNVLPDIRRFYHQNAGTLSGGQQQMVSIGRALLSRPRCLLMDEPSLGLAPKLFQDVMGPIRKLQKSTGMSILLVEQNVFEALKMSDRTIVMKAGQIIWSGASDQLQNEAHSREKLRELY
jgi:branched-chain amino acid transport system ATP-binding protein